MRLKSLMCAVILAAPLFFLNGCSSDDESPSLQFKSSDGETITLKDSKLYLTDDGGANEHVYRDYMISDGELKEGEYGWSISDYTGGTYYFVIELAVPIANDFASGHYPQTNSWSTAEADANISFIYLENEDGTEYYTEDANSDESPVKVSGGFEDGDKMTLKFKGKLTYYYDDAVTGWTEKEVTGEFYYSGEVIDWRD